MIVIIMTIMIMMMIMIMKLITKFPLKRPISIAVFGKAEGSRGLYENWDFDQDGKITIDEVRTVQYSICKKKHPSFVTCQISNVDEYKIIFSLQIKRFAKTERYLYLTDEEVKRM